MREVVHFILRSAKPYKKYLLGMMLTMMGVAICTNVHSYLIKLIIDYFSGYHSYSPFLLIGVLIAQHLCNIGFWALFDIYDIKLDDMKNYILNSFLSQISKYEISFFHGHLSGSISNKFKDAANLTESLLFSIIINFLQFLVMITIALILLARINIWLSLVTCTLTILYLCISFHTLKKGSFLSEQSAEAYSATWGVVGDILGNITAIHHFAAFSRETKNLHQTQKKYNRTVYAKGIFYLKFHACSGLFFLIWEASLMYFIFFLYNTRQISTGDIVFIFTISLRIISHVSNLAHSLRQQFDNYGIIKNALNLLRFNRYLVDAPQAAHFKALNGNIDFENITFHYKGSTPLFNNLSVHITAGQKVGLVGYSGSGKSTFINLLLRFYDPNQGCILIDRQDIKKVTQTSLRKSLGIIPQEPALFHRSILENIQYGRPDASREEIIEAAKKAHAHEFIMDLKDKYNTLVGERGAQLSGGQRQRIALARVILKNAPILILDEATSQLDTITEHLIQQTLWHLMQGKTTLIVAHRLSTLLQMDRILVFDKGNIVEDGTHEELLLKKGLYKRLWDTQTDGLLPEKRQDTNQER